MGPERCLWPFYNKVHYRDWLKKMRWSGTIHHPLYYYLVNPNQSKQNPFPTRFPPSKNEPIEYSNQIIGKEFPFFSIIFPFILLAIFGKLPAKFWALYLGSPYTNMSYGFFSQVFMLCSHIYRNTSGTHPPTTHTSIDLATLFHC